MNIGKAAALSGVSAKMIRYYEDSGLIPPPPRRASGYRDYDDRDVERLRFVRRARDLGFSVQRIAVLLALWSDGARASADVKRVAEEQSAFLRGRVAEMERMIATLDGLADRCPGDAGAACPIIDGLATGTDDAPAARHAPRRFGTVPGPRR